MTNDESVNRALNKIVQWNMESYRTKFSELKLLNRHHPAGICLLETLITRKRILRHRDVASYTEKWARKSSGSVDKQVYSIIPWR